MRTEVLLRGVLLFYNKIKIVFTLYFVKVERRTVELELRKRGEVVDTKIHK